jgi:hypothetical protein
MANGYEKLIKILKSQSDSSSNIFLATMESPDSCYINNLRLDKEDLLIAEHLTTKYAGIVTQTGSTITVEYIEPLKKGDTVLAIKLNDTKYAIVERLV